MVIKYRHSSNKVQDTGFAITTEGTKADQIPRGMHMDFRLFNVLFVFN